MRILFFDWETFGDWDIVEALSFLGHEVVLTKLKPKLDARDDTFILKCVKLIRDKKIELCFTSNFKPVVATSCYRTQTCYMAWVYDSPQMLLYNKEIVYPTNFVFLFDSRQYEDLRQKGIDTVYYMPLAANAARMDKLSACGDINSRYCCDVAFVGSLYNSEHNFYDRMRAKLSDYDAGYLEALMHAQQNVYGYYFLEDILYDSSVLSAMERVMPYTESEDNYATKQYCYGNYFLGRKLATLERIDKLRALSGKYHVNIYTLDDTDSIPGIHNMGAVEYYDEMPLAFRCAKINLNISLRTIQHGIPLRCFDIMGSGGFLLTNYQQDFMSLFEPDVDYVYYDSKQDMLDKVAYYLAHDDKRRQIAAHGHDTVRNKHSYRERLAGMIQVVSDKAGL